MTITTPRRHNGRIRRISRRLLQQNQAYADAWTRWAHPRRDESR